MFAPRLGTASLRWPTFTRTLGTLFRYSPPYPLLPVRHRCPRTVLWLVVQPPAMTPMLTLFWLWQGLVKSKITDVYWKLVELRMQINKARLGMSID